MTPPPSTTSAELASRLEKLLATQLGRIRRRFLIHGAGWLIAAVAIATLAYYVADRGLGLPPALRLLITTALAAYLIVVLRRRVLYPLSRAFSLDDVAVAMERRFPELRERLISAVQLHDAAEAPGAAGDAPLRNQSAAMIERLVEEAAAAVQQIPYNKLLDPKHTVRVWSVSAGATAALLLVAAAHPAAFSVFMSRVLGSSSSYPRQTNLFVELRESNEYRIEQQPGTARVTMAAGADLPVLVRAEGVVPREVYLAVRGGRGMPPRIAMTARGQARFRHMFRRVSDGFSFHALGGDDDQGDLEVEVVTVRPPRVETIRATLTPPDYTGLDPVTLSGGAMEALQGTEVEMQVTATSEVGQARLVFLESGQQIELSSDRESDDEGTRVVWTGRFRAERSDRYNVQLVSPDGLQNPHPGTYPIAVVTDHAPTGRILAPTDDSLSVVLPNAIVPFRMEARDDYGLVAARIAVQLSKVEKTGTVDLLPSGQTATPRRLVATQFLEVSQLPIAGAKPSVGDTITVGAVLVDNRRPDAHTTEIPGRQVHVVGSADLARRIAGHFRRIREDVESQLELQERMLDALQDTVEALHGGATRDQQRDEVAAIQIGQARLQGRASRTHTELMRSFDLHLFNRLEDSPHAARVLELYLAYHREHPVADGFLPGFYKMLGVERREGRLGSMAKTLDPILEMTLSCARISTELAPASVHVLNGAAVAAETAELSTALTEAARLQREILDELKRLVDRLREWNDFQDVIIQTRSVLDKQRDVQIRTRDTLRGGKK